jgi:glutamate synthase (NADPH/NADH) small chain
MADPKGFLKTRRGRRRPAPGRRLRLRDWREVYEPFAPGGWSGRRPVHGLRHPVLPQRLPAGQPHPGVERPGLAARLGEAADRLHATNNFPEFTGRLCPAPCEAACVLGINADPVTIKQVEVEIIDRAFAEGWVVPLPPAALTGRTVAVIGSGPAGLAAAQQLTRAGHAVTVFERDEAPGGLLRYGIPEFKMEKRHLDRRLDQMRAEGTEFRCGVEAGTDITAGELRATFDAVVLAGGARVPRDLPLPGRELAGIHQAMEYLPPSNRAVAAPIPAAPADQRPRAARGHHRRRRHRRGLPGHLAPAGRGVGDAARDHAPAAEDPRGPATSPGRPTR